MCFDVVIVLRVSASMANAKRNCHAITAAVCDDKTHACVTSSLSFSDPYLIIFEYSLLTIIASTNAAIFFRAIIATSYYSVVASAKAMSIISFCDNNLNYGNQRLIHFRCISSLLKLNFHAIAWIDHLAHLFVTFTLLLTIAIQLVGFVMTTLYPRAYSVLIRPI